MPEITPFTPSQQLRINTQTGSSMMQPQTATPSTKVAVQQPQVQAPVEEVAAPAVEEVKKEEPDPRFLALSKKEKALRDRELKVQAQLKELEEKYKPERELLELKEKDKFKAAEKLGLTYEEWTNHQLGELNQTPEQIAERKALQIVEQKLAEDRELRKREQEQQFQVTYQQALKDIAQEAKTFAESSQEFPLVKSTQSFDTITSLIEQTYHDTGKIMSVEEAIKFVEKSFKEDLDELNKLLNPQKEEPKPQPVTQVPQKQLQTLTHKTTVSPSPVAPEPNESWEQRKRRLIEKYS